VSTPSVPTPGWAPPAADADAGPTLAQATESLRARLRDAAAAAAARAALGAEAFADAWAVGQAMPLEQAVAYALEAPAAAA
jgi:hypothetical protein